MGDRGEDEMKQTQRGDAVFVLVDFETAAEAGRMNVRSVPKVISAATRGEGSHGHDKKQKERVRCKGRHKPRQQLVATNQKHPFVKRLTVGEMLGATSREEEFVQERITEIRAAQRQSRKV